MSAATQGRRGAPSGPRGKEIAPGVREWKGSYYGAKDALIGADSLGLIDGDFPGDPGKRKGATYVDRDGRRYCIRRSTPPRFSVQPLDTGTLEDEIAHVLCGDDPYRVVATTIRLEIARGEEDYIRSRELRNRDGGKDTALWERHRDVCRGEFRGVKRKAHGWCVDFTATPSELVRAGLALPEWFRGDPIARRIIVDRREIELYRPDGFSAYEMSIPYQDGSVIDRRS